MKKILCLNALALGALCCASLMTPAVASTPIVSNTSTAWGTYYSPSTPGGGIPVAQVEFQLYGLISNMDTSSANVNFSSNLYLKMGDTYDGAGNASDSFTVPANTVMDNTSYFDGASAYPGFQYRSDYTITASNPSGIDVVNGSSSHTY